MTSQSISIHARWQPPRSHDHGLQWYLQRSSITASKCIAEFTHSWPPGASSNSLEHGLHVLLCVDLLWTSKCISKLAWSRPTCTSLSSQDHSVVNWWSSHYIRTEFVRKSSSGSSRVGRGWRDMMGCSEVRNHTYCVDEWKVGKTVCGMKCWVRYSVYCI